MGASAERTSPEPSEQPQKGRVGYFTSESNFALWTHTRHKTIILLPVKESEQVWKAIKRLYLEKHKVVYLQGQREEHPVALRRVYLYTEMRAEIGSWALGGLDADLGANPSPPPGGCSHPFGWFVGMLHHTCGALLTLGGCQGWEPGDTAHQSAPWVWRCLPSKIVLQRNLLSLRSVCLQVSEKGALSITRSAPR